MDLLTFDQVAAELGVSTSRVRQHVRDGQLVTARDADGKAVIPARFVQDGRLVKHLAPVITLLRDAKFADPEILEWLFRPDDTLPGAPIDALRDDRATEVKRRAQVAGY